MKSLRQAAILGLILLLAPAFWGGRPLATASRDCRRGQWNPQLMGMRQQIIYEQRKTRVLTLYLLRPRHPAQELNPVVLYLHGGGLRSGTGIISSAPTPHNRLLVALERHLMREHIDFVSINYRLAPLHPWPDPLHDVEHAIGYLDRHGAALHMNTNDMAVIGDSAGGELSSFVGLTMSVPGTRRPAVRGVVDLFGPTDREKFASAWRARHGLIPNPVYGVYTPGRVRKESAISHVHAGAPPFLIVQGSRDRVVPPWQSWLLKKKLQKCGVSAKEILVGHAGHELVAQGGPIHPGIPRLVGIINQFLRQRLLTATNRGGLKNASRVHG